MRSLSGNESYCGRAHPQQALHPFLRVTTGSGTFDCACTMSIHMYPGASNTDAPYTYGPNNEGFGIPGLMGFDLSGIVGTPTAATLFMADYGAGGTYPHVMAVNFANPPRIVCHPEIEWGNPVGGLASTVARDSDLKSHPRVMWYDDFNHRSDARLRRDWVIAEPIAAGDTVGKPHEYNDSFAEWGVTALRCHNH